MFLAGLIVFGSLYVMARATRNDGIVLSAVVLAFVWAAWFGFITFTEIYDPWWFGIAIDAVAAFTLTIPGASRNRVILACLYWLQIAVHTSYGWVRIAKGIEPYDLYMDTIDGIAILQILFVGGWSIVDVLRGRGVHPLDRGEADHIGLAKRGAKK